LEAQPFRFPNFKRFCKINKGLKKADIPCIVRVVSMIKKETMMSGVPEEKLNDKSRGCAIRARWGGKPQRSGGADLWRPGLRGWERPILVRMSSYRNETP